MHDVIEVAPQLAMRRTALKRKLTVPKNRPKNVIEVVSNPAGERANCLHLLRLSQLSFELFLDDLCLFLLSDVDRGAGEPIGFTLRVDQAASAREQPMPVAVALADAILAFKSRCDSFEMILHCRLESRRIVGMHDDLVEP